MHYFISDKVSESPLKGAYVRKVTEQLGYQLSNGITPLSFKNKVKKAVYLAGLWAKKAIQ